MHQLIDSIHDSAICFVQGELSFKDRHKSIWTCKMQDECVCYWGTFLFDHYIASIASFVKLGVLLHNSELECSAAE